MNDKWLKNHLKHPKQQKSKRNFDTQRNEKRSFEDSNGYHIYMMHFPCTLYIILQKCISALKRYFFLVFIENVSEWLEHQMLTDFKVLFLLFG